MDSLLNLFYCKVAQAQNNRTNEIQRCSREEARDDSDPFESVIAKIQAYVCLRGVPTCSSFRKIRPDQLWLKYNGTESSFSMTNSLTRFAGDFVRRMSELCTLFGIELSTEEKDLELVKYQYLALLGVTIPQLKFSLNLAFTKYWGEVPPEGKVGEDFMGLHLFPRRMRVRLSCMRGVLRSRRSFRTQTLMNTLFQGFKKGLLPVEPHLIQKTLDKHRVCLTKDPSISSELQDSVLDKANVLFSRWNPNLSTESMKQSTKATTQVSCGNGGNIGYARACLYGNPSIREGRYCAGYYGVLSPTFIGYVERVGVFSQPEPVYQYGPVFLSDMLDLFPSRLYEKRSMKDDPFSTCLEAAPACILEPLKVRMITKPSVGLHVPLHKIQKSCWRYLHDYNVDGFEPFSLIGEPLTRAHLWKLVMSLKPGEKMVSGDYSAATDNLKGEVSKTIIRSWVDKIGLRDPFLYENILRSMTQMRILQENIILPNYEEFPHLKDFCYELQNYDQVNGQLMGNVISFVVLCAANFICLWESYERFCSRKVSLRAFVHDMPAYINGDDILFKSPSDEFYAVWKQTTSEFGFDLSIGKNFCNDKFVQINSELYRIDTQDTLEITEDFDGFSFKERPYVKNLVKIPYVNFGKITGRAKNDCSTDLTLTKIGSMSVTSRGVTEEDSLLGRLKNAPRISTELLTDSGPLGEEALKLYRTHNIGVFRHFGLAKYQSSMDDPCFQAFWAKHIVRNVKNVENDKIKVCDDLCVKLDRGTLEFDYRMVRSLERDLSFPTDLSVEKLDWKRC